MRIYSLIIKLSHRLTLLALGFLGRPLLDAVLVSMLVLCLIAYQNKASGKFWQVENSDEQDFLETPQKQSRLIIDWSYLGKGLFYIIWMLAIAFACYFVGRYLVASW